jgi:predicted nucleic acid-binding protein
VIFPDTNVISETFRKLPDEAVISWLGRYDAEIALSTVAIAEIAFGIQKIVPDQRAARLERDCLNGGIVSLIGSSALPERLHWTMAS